MSLDAAFRRLEQANPVPDPGTRWTEPQDLTALLTATEQRSTEMQTDKLVTAHREKRRPPRRNWMIALASGLAVALIAVLVGILPPSDTELASSTPTPLDVAESWIASYEAGNVDGFQGLIAADAWWANVGRRVPEGPYFTGTHGAATTDARDSLITYAAHGSLGASCAAEGSVVSCEINQTDIFRQLGEIEPFRFTYVFTVEEGLITDLKMFGWIPDGDLGQPQRAEYEEWLAVNHPEEHEELFFLRTMIVETGEQAERHRELISEWAGITEPAPTPTTLAAVEVPTTVAADVPAAVEPFTGNGSAGTYRPFFFEPSFVFSLTGEGWAATENAESYFALVPPGGYSEAEFEEDALLFFVAPELGSVDETLAFIEGISALEVSEPQPTSIGGADGMLVIATATESTVPIWTDDKTVFYGTVAGHQYRFHVLDVDGVPVVITLDYRNEEQYQRLLPTVEEFLGSISWNDQS